MKCRALKRWKIAQKEPFMRCKTESMFVAIHLYMIGLRVNCITVKQQLTRYGKNRFGNSIPHIIVIHECGKMAVWNPFCC